MKVKQESVNLSLSNKEAKLLCDFAGELTCSLVSDVLRRECDATDRLMYDIYDKLSEILD